MDHDELADRIGADVKALQLKYGFDEYFLIARKGRNVSIVSEFSTPTLIRPFYTLVYSAFKHVGNTLFEKIFTK